MERFVRAGWTAVVLMGIVNVTSACGVSPGAKDASGAQTQPARSARSVPSTPVASAPPALKPTPPPPEPSRPPADALPDPRAETLLQEAKSLTRAKQFRPAIVKYQTAIATFGRNARVLADMASVYLEWESYPLPDDELLLLDKEAIQVLVEALEADPQSPEVAYLAAGAGGIFARNGEFVQAERLHRVAVAGGIASSNYGLAQALHGQRRYAEAVKQYQVASDSWIQQAPGLESFATDPQPLDFARFAIRNQLQGIEFDMGQAAIGGPLPAFFWKPFGDRRPR